MSYLIRTQPHRYSIQDLCPLCFASQESWSHVYLCSKQCHKIYHCVDLTAETISELIEDNKIDDHDEFCKNFRKLDIWSVPETSTSRRVGSSNNMILEIIQGYVPYVL